MRRGFVRAIALVGLCGLLGCGGTDHRLLGNTQGASGPIASPPAGSVVVVPPAGLPRVCPHGATIC
jgi:hypothetical protein